MNVCVGHACIAVKLVDWCGCGGDHVIDLFHGAFRALAAKAGLSTGRGGLPVVVKW